LETKITFEKQCFGRGGSVGLASERTAVFFSGLTQGEEIEMLENDDEAAVADMMRRDRRRQNTDTHDEIRLELNEDDIDGDNDDRLSSSGNHIHLINSDEFTSSQKRKNELVKAVLFGQFIAFIVAISALFTKLLVDDLNAASPAFQLALGYGTCCLLFLYPFYQVNKTDPLSWKTILSLFFVSIADSQASFLGNLAYNFEVSIASVGMLSSFTIPCAMVLSYFFLRVRYKTKHFLGTFIALLGLVFVVTSDILVNNGDTKSTVNGTSPGSSNGTTSDISSAVIGDLLVILGSAVYAVSNVASEAFVKSGSIYQYLVWLGFFGCIISLCQFAIFEAPTSFKKVENSSLTAFVFIGYALVFALIYWTAAKFLAMYDSVVFNLSLLTTDVWGLIFGLLIFNEYIHVLKLLGFAFVVAGVVIYNLESPTRLNENRTALVDQDDAEIEVG
jgi:solute carrier family 35 protein F1/2